MITNNNTALLAQTESNIALGALSNALSVSNTLTPANPIEQNYADFYQVYLNYKQDTISVSDSTMLSNLANGCVQKDGIVVFQARALYSLIYHVFKNYSDDCIGLYQNKSNPSSMHELLNILPIDKENNDFEIYPSPSNGDLWLKYSGTNVNTNIEISIFDLSGRLVFNKNFNVTGKAKISTELNNGSYLFSITHKGKSIPVYRGKLLIIK